MKSGIVVFAGAGPGASDLITVRAMEAVKEADAIVYAGSLVNPEILRNCKGSCAVYDSSKMNLDEIVGVMSGYACDNKKVLRLHTGDPSVYGAIAEQMSELDKKGIAYEVIPGVTSAFAAAASVNAELTMAGLSQTVIFTRRAGRTPVPDKQDICSLASHNATMCIYLSIADIDGLVNDLIKGGYRSDTSVVVVYRASWDDEKIVKGNLENISAFVKDEEISRQAMVIVGDVLKRAGDYSLLYDASFSHGYRIASE